MPFPNLLASGVAAIAGEDPFHLFAGESDTVTSQGDFVADTVQFAVLGRVTASGLYQAWDPVAVDGSEVAVAIAAQPVDVSEQVAGPVYIGGFFNHEALIWPVAADTLAERKAAFDGTPINIGKLL